MIKHVINAFIEFREIHIYLKPNIFKYIENNSGNDALSIWYKLVLVDKNEKVKFLFQNLNLNLIYFQE